MKNVIAQLNLAETDVAWFLSVKRGPIVSGASGEGVKFSVERFLLTVPFVLLIVLVIKSCFVRLFYAWAQ